MSPRVCGGLGSASSAWAQARFAKVWLCQGARHEPNGWAVELCLWALLCCQGVGVLSTPCASHVLGCQWLLTHIPALTEGCAGNGAEAFWLPPQGVLGF